MAWLLYYFAIWWMVAGIRLSSGWNRKSKKWIEGRKHWLERVRSLPPKKSPRIWFHVSSLGEFEQARPVIEMLKRRRADLDIILTFFSPSGYELRSGYAHATVMYLPPDLPGNAKKWVSVLEPDGVIFVKYDLWPGYLKALQDQGIPSILISAHWIPGSRFSSWALPPVNGLLKKMTMIFFQQPEHLDYFRRKGFSRIQHAGDTRIDRSLELPGEAPARLPALLREAGPFDLVAGSTWPKDEEMLATVIQKLNLNVILAPHDVSDDNIRRLIASLPFPVTRLSAMSDPEHKPHVVIVDSIGLLSSLYVLGKIAYVGGGYGAGIHNTLEPMAHQKPLIFGPRYRKFPEAVDMVRMKCAIPVKNSAGLEQAMRHFQERGHAEEAGKRAFEYLRRHAGASVKVADYIQELIPFDPQHDNQPGN